MSEVSKELEKKLTELSEYILTEQKNVSKEIHEADLKLVDMYHFIEFHPSLNAAAGYMAYKKLGQILIDRRKAKDNLATLNMINVKQFINALSDLEKADEAEEDRIYHARTGDYENIPGVTYFKAGEKPAEVNLFDIAEKEREDKITKLKSKLAEYVIEYGSFDDVQYIAMDNISKVAYLFTGVIDAFNWIRKRNPNMDVKQASCSKKIENAANSNKDYFCVRWDKV